MTAQEIIYKHFKGHQNFMTPNTIKTGMATDSIAYEISSGKGITGKTIYGVTFVRLNEDKTTEQLFDLSECCDSVAKAYRIISGVN